MLNKRIISLFLSFSLLLSALGITTAVADASKAAEPIKARIGVSFDSYAVGVKPACVDPTDLNWRNGTSVATATVTRGSNAVGFSKTISYDSSVREGQGPFNGTPCLIFMPNMVIDHNTNTFMMYVKTPEIGTESPDPYPPYDWAVRVEHASISQNGNTFTGNAYANNFDPKIDYLANGSSNWVSSKVDDMGTIYVPSGFEGYIKFHMDTATGFTTWQSAGFDPNSDYVLSMFNVIFGWLGADYGAYEIGGIYAITEDSNSTSLLLEGEELPDELSSTPSAIEAERIFDINDRETGDELDSAVVEITDGKSDGGSAVSNDITVSSMKGWNWINKDGSILSNVSYSTDATKDQAASALVPNKADGAWDGAYVFKSKDGSLTGPIAGKADERFNLQWAHVAVDESVDEVMFYVELPDYSKSSADWALALGGFELNETWSNVTSSVPYSYLSVTGDKWIDATSVTVGENMQAFKALPSGFKGYIRFDFNDFSYWGSINLDSAYQLENMTFFLNSVGGACGDMVFGGIFYTLSNNATGLDMNVNGEKFTLSTGESSSGGSSDGPTKLKATVGEAVVPKSEDKAIVINSGNSEGNGINGYSPKVTLKLNSKLEKASSVIMLYVECPEIPDSALSKWSFAVSGIKYTQNKKTVTGKFDNAKYSYIEGDGEEWKSAKTNSDSLITLPSGFKGYVKLYLNTAATLGGEMDFTKSYTLASLDIIFNYIGGENGAFVIGNIYCITKDSKGITMKLDGGKETAMTDVVDCMQISQRYDFSTNENGADVTATGLVSIGDHTGWRPGTSQLTATIGDEIDILPGGNKAICFNSPVAEGEGPNNAAPYISIWTWAKISSQCNTFMLYVEAPRYNEMSNVNWSLRCTGMSLQQEGASGWFYSDFANAEYAYLESDANEWVKCKSDGNGTLALPNGFKGYIKLYIDSVGAFGGWSSSVGFNAGKDYQLNSLDFLFGHIGGEYGAFKVGSMYQVTKESDKPLAKMNGKLYELTTYRTDNESRVEEFKSIIDSLGDIDIEDTAAVGRAEALLRNMADEYRADMEDKYLSAFEKAKTATEKYRPSFMGVTLKPTGSTEQGMKIGSKASTAAALSEGYAVKACGTVFVYSDKYDEKLDLTAETANSVTVAAEPTVNGTGCTYSAVYAISDFADYGKQISARTYITYYNSALEKEITVWNGNYVFSDGSESQAIQCSLLEAATYFGVSLYR